MSNSAALASDPEEGKVSQSVLDGLTRRFAATAADYDRRAVFPQENFVALREADPPI